MSSPAARRRFRFRSSDLYTALTCPRLFWFGHVEGRETLIGDPEACGIGRRVHRLIAAFEQTQPTSPALQRALARYARERTLEPVNEALTELLYRHALLPELSTLRDTGPVDGAQLLGMWEALSGYARVLAPVLAANATVCGPEQALAKTLLASEMTLEQALEISGGTRCVVRGRLDALWYDHLHQRVLLLEFKTRPAPACGEDALQLAIYHQLLLRTRGIVARGLIAWLRAEAPQQATRTFGVRDMERLWNETVRVHLPHLLSWSRWRPSAPNPLPGPRQPATCTVCRLRAQCHRRFGSPFEETEASPETPPSSCVADETTACAAQNAARREDENTGESAQPVRSPVSSASAPRANQRGRKRGDAGAAIAIRLGTRSSDATPVIWSPNDTRTTPHPNLGILGTMGTGKTQCTRAIVQQLVDAPRRAGQKPLKVLIFDYNGDYTDEAFVASTRARVVQLHALPFNPLAIIDRERRHAPLYHAELFVDSLGRTYRLGARQRNTLRDALLAAYAERGIDWAEPATWGQAPPTLHDMVECYLAGRPAKDSLYAALRQLDDHVLFTREAGEAGGVWERVQGVTVFDLRQGAEALRNLAIACVLDLFYAQMITQPHAATDGVVRELRAFVLVDEADNFMQQRFAALRRLLKEGRKYGVGTILSTQFLDHFVTRTDKYHQAIGTWILHRIDVIDPRVLGRAFGRFTPARTRALAAQLARLGKHESVVLLPGADEETIAMRDLPYYELVAATSR